jgi:trichoplein keratin filament-binding protein
MNIDHCQTSWRQSECVERRSFNVGELLQDELKTTTMGLAERRQWLEARARALKQKRLQENDKYAAEQLNRAWRDNADDIRIHDSKLSVLRAVEGRKRQLEEAVARKILEEEEGRKMEETMAREWHLKEQALLREIEMKEAKKIEAIDILDEQLYMMNALRKEEKDAVRAEMAAMNAKWKQEEEELKLLQHQQRCYQVIYYLPYFPCARVLHVVVVPSESSVQMRHKDDDDNKKCVYLR